MSLKALGLAGVAAATLVTSTAAMTQSAEAQFRRGWGGGGWHGGYGRHYGGWGHRRGGWGGAGAGLAAGLLLGGLAAAATRPAYGYGYGGYAPAYYGGGYAPAYYGGYRPAYYGGYRRPYYGGYRPVYYGGYGGCFWRTRQVWGPYGWQLARVRVCR